MSFCVDIDFSWVYMQEWNCWWYRSSVFNFLNSQPVFQSSWLMRVLIVPLKKKRFYLFIFKEKSDRETSLHQCVVASCVTPHWGLSPQSRHVPWLGIEPVTLWITGRHLIHWATPARALVFLSDFSLPIGCGAVSHCAFHSHFPNVYCTDVCIFLCAQHKIASLKKGLLKSLTHVLSFYILCTMDPFRYRFC